VTRGGQPIAAASVWPFGVAASLASAALFSQSRSTLPSPESKQNPTAKRKITINNIQKNLRSKVPLRGCRPGPLTRRQASSRVKLSQTFQRSLPPPNLHLIGISWISNATAGTTRFYRTADFQVCRIAGFPTRRPFANLARLIHEQARRLGNRFTVPQTSKSAVSRVSQPADRSPTWRARSTNRPADWEIGDEPGFETCGTPAQAAYQVQPLPLAPTMRPPVAHH